MRRNPIRRALLWGVAATLLLPAALAVLIGLGGLLGGLGDVAGSRVCLRTALGMGVVWVIALVATTAASAIAHLDQRPRRRRCDEPHPGRHGRRRFRRRWRDDSGEDHPRRGDRARRPIDGGPPPPPERPA